MSPVQFWLGALGLALLLTVPSFWNRAGRRKEKGKVMEEGHLYCHNCSAEPDEVCNLCPTCGQILDIVYKVPPASKKQISAWECELCDAIYGIACNSCPICHGQTKQLQFKSAELLQSYISRAATEQELKVLQERMPPAIKLTPKDAVDLQKLGYENIPWYSPTGATLASMDEISTQELISSSEQASERLHSLYRLQFARYLVTTGRLSEDA